MAKVLDVTDTDKTNDSIVRIHVGEVRLKYKDGGRTLSYDEAKGADIDTRKPNFAFLEDYYIHSRLLKEANITCDQKVEIMVLLKEGKWNTIEIKKA
ncbi:hypothetical protein ACOBWA_09135 [Psychrobacter sp. ER1]|uniref:hypothetical protein n=1 Tax=Psychrobacter sp. ER1 TaxID=3406645 RepID=UPI003B42FB00